MTIKRRAHTLRRTLESLINTLAIFLGRTHSSGLLVSGLVGATSVFLGKVKIYPRRISLPDGARIFVNDLSILEVQVPDQYIRGEYRLHKDYIPRKGWTVLDIGACTGLYSIMSSKLVGNEGLVLAFEPNPIAYYWLVQNLLINGIENVQTFQVALGEKKGSQELWIVTNGNIGATSLFRDHVSNFGVGAKDLIASHVPMTTLDGFVFGTDKSVKGVLKYCDLMKLDVEGAELRVLEGSRETLEKGLIDRLIVEIHLDHINEDSTKAFLREFGYGADKIVTFDNVKKVAYFSLRK